MNGSGRVERRAHGPAGWAELAVLSLLAALALPAGRARGDAALLFPHGGEASLRAEREAAQQAVQTALGEQGFEVRPAVATSGGASHEGACKQIGCAPVLLAALSAELAVAVAAWKSAEGPRINVTLVDGHGNRFPAVAGIAADGAGGAARRALLAARGLQLLGPGPWVDVSGSPEGAIVSIDGARVGALPYRAALSSGDHVLEVKAQGHAPQRLELRMPLDPTVVHEVSVALAPGADGAAVASATRGAPQPVVPAGDAVEEVDLSETVSKPSVWNYVLGGVAIACGIALATVDPVRAAARDGECANDDCTQVYAFGTESAIKVAAGAVLAAAGVVVMVWAPLRVEAQVDAQAVTLQVRGQF